MADPEPPDSWTVSEIRVADVVTCFFDEFRLPWELRDDPVMPEGSPIQSRYRPVDAEGKRRYAAAVARLRG